MKMRVLGQEHGHIMSGKTSYKMRFSCNGLLQSLEPVLFCTAFDWSIYCLKKAPDGSKYFINLEIVDESGTRSPGELRRNLRLNDL
jgi:hypothetical protein